jgi:glutamate---cysteine ligase / carboxylate-amine ligase
MLRFAPLRVQGIRQPRCKLRIAVRELLEQRASPARACGNTHTESGPMRHDFTLGVEEEYLLVEPHTGELKSAGGVVLDADMSGEVAGELQDTLLEIGTPVCRDAGEVAARLRERRFQAGSAAATADLEVLAVGTHPFSGWKAQALTHTPRSLMLRERFRHLVRLEHIGGMHVHVCVPQPYDRIALLNTVRAFTPHLLALSCSSPFHAGEDTGFCSYRAVTWRRFPLSGASPHFASAAEHDAFMQTLLRSGLIPDERTVYWSVRPSPRYPTLEIRVCDVCPDLADAVAIAALARATVVAAAEGLLTPLGSSLAPALQHVVLTDNEWIAARDGLDARLVAPEHPDGALPVRRAIAELVDAVAPITDALGDADALRRIASILEKGNAAEQMRAEYGRTGELRAVVDWGVRRTRAGTGMDRRRAERPEG